MESHEGLQFPDRPEEEAGTPGPAERRIEDGDADAETPVEERVDVIKKRRADEPEDDGRD